MELDHVEGSNLEAIQTLNRGIELAKEKSDPLLP
jgi:hypothetical protein